MKNNVITIIVDSVLWECVGTIRAKVSPTPFIDSLRGESVVANKMYSPGPYTDSATKSLFTGREGLDDYSFFFKYSASPTNHYKIFKENGYETIGVVYPYYIHGKSVSDYIDHIYYASGFVFSSEWFGLFSYYVDKAKSQALTENDIVLLSARMKLMFDAWIKFYEDIISSEECRAMILECIGEFNVQNALIELKKEYESFNVDKKSYIYKFLCQGNKHVLANIDKIDVEGYIDRQFLKDNIFLRYKNDFDFFTKENIKANWWKNRPRFKQIWNSLKELIKNRRLDNFYCLANYYLCLTSFARMKSLSMQPIWQHEQSSYRHFETAKRAIKSRKTDKPFYLSVHVEEPHNYLACFTYDTDNPSIIDDDFKVLRDYVNELNGEFIGDLSYFLSIRYVDYHIEKFCNFLKEQNMWDSTTLLICSDHGSSYSFYPLHYKHVNCFDDECYHIPMLIRHPRFKGVEIDNYCNSKDILPTLLDVIGLPLDPNFTGRSLFGNKESNNFVITEYTGGGCPDVLSKDLWMSIRDSSYVIGYKIKLESNFDDARPDTVYDLNNDPNGLYNIANSIDINKISYLVSHLKKRYEQVQIHTAEFIEKLKNNTIQI